MQKLTPLTLTLTLTLLGCTPSNPNDVSLKSLLTNPLFAERYAEEMVDSVVELNIQNDPILENRSKAAAIERVRKKWLVVARDATAIQRNGTTGLYIPVHAFGKGEFLYEENTLYTDTIFDVTPGPSLHVYMSTEVDPRDIEFPDASALNLGTLKSPYGAQYYAIPVQENPLLYRTVVLWDSTLERVWGFAQLNK